MTSSVRRTLGTALLIALGASRGAGQVKVLVTSVGYESPALIAPVIVLSSVSTSGMWTVGVAGYTVRAVRVTSHSPTVATVIAAEVTPLNSNSSNYIYRDGRRDRSLAFHDATVQLNAGLRVTAGDQRSRWGIELRAIGIDESVSRLADAAALARWRDPYVGLGIEANYSRVIAEEILAARWDGVKAAAGVIGLAGARPWWRSQLSLSGGKRLGKVSFMGRAWALLGGNLDVVNQHLVGGSWDLDRSPSLYGYHYAEFRVDRGIVVGAGADLRLAGTWELGLRTAYLSSPSRTTYGEAVRMSTVLSGIVFHVGVGLPRASLFHRETSRPLLFAGVSGAVL